MSDVVTSVPAFINEVLKYFDDWPDATGSEPELWFRGVNDANYSLLPGAYWRSDCDELSLFVGFQNAAPLYLLREPLDDWDWYYVMQHYGLPTRLLDWTESPLAALYFALESAKDAAGCVWVLDPAALNGFTYRWKQGLIVAPGDDDTKHWLPTHCGRHREPTEFAATGVLKGDDGTSSTLRDNRKPLAIFARRSSPRIVAQRGVFTVHGSDEIPIDNLLSVRDSSASTRLAKITIDPTCCERMLRSLRALGINKTTLFPEAQSVADDLKRMYKITG